MAEHGGRLLALSALFLVGLAVVLVVRGTLTVGDADSSAAAAPCRTGALDDLRGRTTCRTSSATLTVADERTPLLLGGTQARVLEAELDDRTVVVRLRLRRPDGLRRARIGARQVYLNVGGRRFDHAPIFGRRDGGRTTTRRLRFRLPRKTARQLRRGEVRADLGVVPFEHVGAKRPPRLGVVRLDLP